MSFSITEILEYRTAHTPELIALQDVDGFITYSDWLEKAQRMARMFSPLMAWHTGMWWRLREVGKDSFPPQSHTWLSNCLEPFL